MILSRMIGDTSKIIPYSDSAIQWLGRWVDGGAGKWVGWSGAQMIFRVKGTTWIDVVSDITDPDTTQLTFISSNIDNGEFTVYYWTTAAQTGAGLKKVRINLPDTAEHTVIMKNGGLNSGIYNQVSKSVIAQLVIPSSAEIKTWNIGTTVVQCVGDSWMGTENDWPRLMGLENYKLWPIATGGLTCANMDAQYNNDYSGQPNSSDINADAVIVSFGVNDFNASVTTAAFETSLDSLFDKIRAKQPTAKIFLIRVPKNISANKDYGQYGPIMLTVVNAKTNAVYLDTTSLDATIGWANGDVNHLSAAGKQTLADWVKVQLISNGIL